MPRYPRVPVSVRRCVRAVAQKDGDVSRAFAICVAQGQQLGDLQLGTVTPTAQGKRRSRRKSGEPDAGVKAAEYEKILAGARADESLCTLVMHGFSLIEQEDAPSGADDLSAALSGDIGGDLQVLVTFPVGTSTDDTRRAALKLLKHYQRNFHGGVGGLSVWSVSSMRVRYRRPERMIEIELWLNVKNYPGLRVLSDLVQQVSAAALELSRSMLPKDAKNLLGGVTPAVVTVEPVEFVQTS